MSSITLAIGLTGGIGSGKTTVARMFAHLDIPVLDLDCVGRALLDEKRVQEALVNAFGRGIQNHLGGIDRQSLAKLVFSDPQRTAELNAVMHPEILCREQAWLAEQTAPYAIVEASVLLESGSVDRMDGVVVVLANETLRKERVLSRGKQDEIMFEAIKQRQCDDAVRRKYADYIVRNEGSLASLNKPVLLLSQQLSG